MKSPVLRPSRIFADSLSFGGDLLKICEALHWITNHESPKSHAQRLGERNILSFVYLQYEYAIHEYLDITYIHIYIYII